MPPKTPYPTPVLRFHNGAWKVIWRHDGKQYSVSTGFSKNDKLFAEKCRVEFAIALKKDFPEFPDSFRHTPSVQKYIDDRFGIRPEAAVHASPEQWIDGYINDIRGKNTPGWIRDSAAALKRLETVASGLHRVTSQGAAQYMADIAAERAPGTHNRRLTMFKKFYSWLVNTNRHNLNPFEKIKRLKESKDASIVYCTRAERDEIIILAMATGWPEWPAVLIAFLTGMRRGEIANLRWEDIRLENGLLSVRKTKTQIPRTLPLSGVLEEFLLGETDRSGYVIKSLPGKDRLGRLYSLTNKIRKLKKASLTREWRISKPPPSKAKDFKMKWNAYEAEIAKRKALIDEALERISWNVFRHTFGSLLAQAGVSIDKISSWMGNTPEVCRRHYAQFVPRDRRDNEIDYL